MLVRTQSITKHAPMPIPVVTFFALAHHQCCADAEYEDVV